MATSSSDPWASGTSFENQEIAEIRQQQQQIIEGATAVLSHNMNVFLQY